MLFPNIYFKWIGHWSFGASFYKKQLTLDYLLATSTKPLVRLYIHIHVGHKQLYFFVLAALCWSICFLEGFTYKWNCNGWRYWTLYELNVSSCHWEHCNYLSTSYYSLIPLILILSCKNMLILWNLLPCFT